MATFWRSIPGLASQFRQIPDEFWVEDADDAGHTLAVVACPCGESPGVLALASDECPCGRIYFFDSRHVYVGNSPVPAVRAIPWPEGEPIPGEPSGGPTA